MSQLMPSRRPSSRLRLRVRSTDDLTDTQFEESGHDEPRLPWYASSFLAGLGSAAAGWLLVVAVVLLSWLSARAGALSDALKAGNQFWLLANGAGLSLGGHQWTLVPLVLTFLLAYIVSLGGGFAARQALLGDTEEGGGMDDEERRQSVRNVTLATALGYVVAVTFAAGVGGSTTQITRALIASAVLGTIASYWGASKAFRYRATDAWPAWARAIPGAVKAAVATMIATGSAVIGAGVLLRRERVTELAAELGADGGSGLVLLFSQLLYLPNFILWGASWALGAGFQIGADSVVAPGATEIGLMPAIPILGALPSQGVDTRWMLVWMVSGVLAGAASAAIVMRRRPRARFDETGVVGGLSGVLAALAFTALAALSTGGLGSGRLSVMGPRLPELAVLGSALMGLSGMAVGLIWGIVRRPIAQQATLPAWEDEHEDTLSEPADDYDVDEYDVDEYDEDDGSEVETPEAPDEEMPDEEVPDEEVSDEEVSDEEVTEIVPLEPAEGPDAPVAEGTKRRWWRFGR